MVDSQSEHTEGLNPIQIRLLRQDDIEIIRPILECWIRHWETGDIIPEEIDEIIKEMENSINNPNISTYLVAETPLDGVIGVVGFRPPTQEMLPFVTVDKATELTNFYVAEKHRGGKGIGTSLLNAIEQRAVKRGYEQIVLNSGPRYKETAWGFYDKMGYARVGEVKDMYGPGVHAPVWSKTLTK